MKKIFHFHSQPKLRTLSFIFAAISFCASGGQIINLSGKSQIPSPASMSVSVETHGRTSILKSVDIAKITSSAVPDTFSDTLIHNSKGFTWYVSRHFAVKTNLSEDDAADSLALLETAWPQYVAVFGRTPPGMDYRRLAIVLASDRNSLEKAMTDDDMHILNLGGITQEGFACAYLYAGISYQTRYILLHETTHLFQYCISGNTRNCYGFFVEGIADFFSSHVYNKSTRTLTVNVLDRAPIHNHLAAGIEEWQRRGQPSFSDLYENHRGSRGLDVILTAFLQSTPEYERNWLAYCTKISENSDATKAKALSDNLILSLYGDFKSIDKAFANWMNQLTPSFLTGIREFDQDGDSFISVYAPSETTPATLTLTNPRLSTSDFVLDWPHSAPDKYINSNSVFDVDIKLPAGKDCPVIAGLRFYSREMRLIKESAITNTRPKQVSASLSFTESDMSDSKVSASSCIAEMFASAPGVVFTPVTYSPESQQKTQYSKAAGCRFMSTSALPRLISAAKLLGNKAPQQLLISIEALKAPKSSSLVLPEDTETQEFWESISKEISKANVNPDLKNKVLCELSGIKLSVSKIKGKNILVELLDIFPAPEKAEVRLLADNDKNSPSENNGTSAFIFKDPRTACRVHASVKWLGCTLEIEAEYESGRQITEWHILGPFQLTNGQFSNETFPPDTYPLDLEKVFTAEDGSRIFWKEANTSGGNQNTPPLLHFAKEFGRQANFSAAYAYAEINSDKTETCELVLGVSDGIQVWNNSVPVFCDMNKREWSDANIRIPLTLKKGSNKLLFKLIHSNGVWFLSARISPKKNK